MTMATAMAKTNGKEACRLGGDARQTHPPAAVRVTLMGMRVELAP